MLCADGGVLNVDCMYTMYYTYISIYIFELYSEQYVLPVSLYLLELYSAHYHVGLGKVPLTERRFSKINGSVR